MIRIYARPSWKRRVVRGKVDRQYWPSRMSESNLDFFVNFVGFFAYEGGLPVLPFQDVRVEPGDDQHDGDGDDAGLKY